MSQPSPVIFIVDDKLENCKQLEVMLADLSMGILTFQSAQSALDKLQEIIPLILILDADMPEMDGYQMINQMQADDAMRHIPVLLMTPNFSDAKQMLYSPLMEVIDTIAKPISPGVLIEKVRAAKELDRYQKIIAEVLDDDGQAMRKKHEGVLALDELGHVKFVNSSALRMLRTTAPNLVDTYFESLFQDPCETVVSEWEKHPIPKVCMEGNILQVEETKLWCADGDSIRVKLAAIPLFDQPELNMFVAFKIINEDPNSKDKLEALMHLDQLTGLPNREKFGEKLDLEIGRIRKENTWLAVLYIDLLHFKNINESLGHQIGDEVLKSVAERLNKSVRIGDFVGRIGGDVFAVVVNGITSPGVSGQVAQKILTSLKAPYLVKGYEVFVGCNIGIATYPNSGSHSSVLLKNADLATDKAKALGSDNYQYFSAEMNREILERLSLEKSFRKSIQSEGIEFELVPIYQGSPKVICGYEMVPTWTHETHGVMTSEQFYPIAEQTGLMVDLGFMMFEQGCKFLAGNLSAIDHQSSDEGEGNEHGVLARVDKPFICFRVTPQQIVSSDFSTKLTELAKEQGLSHHQLILELCETQFSRYQASHLEALKSIYNLGFKVLLANFGMGYAPFNMLLDLPLNVVKLPSDLVERSMKSDSVEQLFLGILAMAQKMQLYVWVDQVNNQETLDFLSGQHIEYMQGSIFNG